MARPPKQGIDFSGWDTDIFENDTKIDELLEAQGWIGWSIYFYLCQKAYASDGYFYRWSDANAATTARRMGGGIRSETVRQTVGACLRIGLFDRRLYDLGGVLTSRGIQRRYARAIQSRRYKKVNIDYWLLDPEETKGFGVMPENVSLPEANEGLHQANEGLHGANDHKSRVEKSRVKESRVEESKPPETDPAGAGSDDTDTLIRARQFPPKLEGCVRDWAGYKEESGGRYGTASLYAFLVQVSKKMEDYTTEEICDVIEESIAAGYKGVVWDRMEKRRRDAERKAQAQHPDRGGGYDYETIRGYLDD